MAQTTQTTTTTTVSGRSMVVAYVLWFFLGSLGIHRFYLGRTGTAIAMIALSVIGWATIVFGIGTFFLGALGIWLIVDIFLIPGMVNSAPAAKAIQLYQTTTTTTVSDNSSKEDA